MSTIGFKIFLISLDIYYFDIKNDQTDKVEIDFNTSMIQRRLKLGYNRAGRIIDELEAAGIVGHFAGSKASQVLVRDEMALDELLNELNN